MNENADPLSMLARTEFNRLRSQAFDIFDRCLAENNAAPIIAFIEKQVTGDPPHLALLRDFADGLHHRILSLRVNHFDIRDNVIRTFAESYGVDITPLLPANQASKYHDLDKRKVLEYATTQGNDLTEKDRLLLGKLLDASTKTAGRLDREIRLADDLQTLVNDWLDALNATVGRRYWSDIDQSPQQFIH